MANKKKVVISDETNDITNTASTNDWYVDFFCYGNNGQYIDARINIDGWPLTRNPTTAKMEHDDALIKFVTFDRWIYRTNDEFEIEFLGKYNTGWKLSNWKVLNATPFPTVSKNKYNETSVTIERIVEKIVAKMPVSVLELLDIATLTDIAKNQFDYEVSSDDKKEIIKEFKEQWFAI